MRRMLSFVHALAAALALLAVAGCVSKQEAHSGAVRFLNAVPDAPRMSLSVDDTVRAAGFDYAQGSSYTALSASTYQVSIDELLPAAADPNTREVYNDDILLNVNDEYTLIVVGSAAAQDEEVISIKTRAQGVPSNQTSIQFAHAAAGVPPVDIYIVDPSAVISASTPIAAALAYKAYTTQQVISSGSRKFVVTPAGDPTTVLLDSGSIYLNAEVSLLITLVPNTTLDAATHPVTAVFMSGQGSTPVVDKSSLANLRVVNASPGAYALDAFVNLTTVDNTARQVCDPGTDETSTLYEFCALPYRYIGTYSTITPSTYEVKAQKTAADTVLAKSFVGTFVGGGESTLVLTGLIGDTATTTNVGLTTLLGTRRIATSAQLRIVDLSIAADAAVSGDPTTDRLEIYITAPGADLTPLDPNFSTFRFGANTGYFYEIPGTYQITIAKSDTATPTVAPVVLTSQVVALEGSGIYTLAIVDSVGGVQPISFLSLDDDPTPAPQYRGTEGSISVDQASMPPARLWTLR